ncbi:MAG: DNA cytosine methyltransferase [Haemophilus haemolyticus]|jgi:DNA (cytosine-5-)-methyltransferase|nr:DNA (cytosine-5-)-methyltransferase [Haemophilus haemolyticus]MDU7463791.1 DNA cytosine methyltransferase [Haemophilus haemolyticus]
MSISPKFLDLFAGGGGLSEGFVRAGFTPVAHIEADAAACFTLRTRQAYHWLKKNKNLSIYKDYLNNKISRDEFYASVPEKEIDSVINDFIDENSLSRIFRKIDSLKNGNIDLIIGGPPCQAYSIIGRAQKNMQTDPRNNLYIYYAEFLKKYSPKYFVFENVTGLLTAKNLNGELYFDKMKQLFESIGYHIEYSVLSAEEYGILQNRKRIILVGKKDHSSGKSFYPFPIKSKINAKVYDLLKDLPSIKAGEGSPYPIKTSSNYSNWLIEANIKSDLPVTWHQARPNTIQDLEIYQLVVSAWNKDKKRLKYNEIPEKLRSHKGMSSFLDRFKVVAGDLPISHTIVAHISKDGHHYIHPDISQNRSLTPREAARIQTFPDDYYFESASGKPSRTSAFKQIGNAVPVLLAQKIAEQLLRNW